MASSALNATRVPAREPLAFEALPAQVRADVPHDVSFAVSTCASEQSTAHRAHVKRSRAIAGAGVADTTATPRPAPNAFALSFPRWPDEMVEYKPVLTRSGLVVMELPARATCGVDAATARSPPLQTGRRPTAVPRYEWASEFLGAFTVQLVKPPESFGPAPDGLHITFYIASGEIHGTEDQREDPRRGRRLDACAPRRCRRSRRSHYLRDGRRRAALLALLRHFRPRTRRI